MADLEPHFELEDALTDHPPEIEPEIKKDFISSIEAEPYDDVIGETCDKTDYVPLLDDEEAKAGSQEQKSKPSADGIPMERTADAQQAVLENGDHEIGENEATESFEMIVDEKAYSDFIPHQEHWPREEFGFESQPVFQLINQPDPFGLNRDVLSDLLLPPDERKARPAFTEHFGDSQALTAAMVPEGCLLDTTYVPVEMDAEAISQNPEDLPEAQLTTAPTEEAAFEADWLEAQRRHVEGAETLIEEASEAVVVIPEDTPSEESSKETSFFSTKTINNDNTAMVWQPTEQEQLALDRRHIPEFPRRAEEAEFTLPQVSAAISAEVEFTEETKIDVQHTEPIVSSETALIECHEPVLEPAVSEAAAVPAGQETTERQFDKQPTLELSEEVAVVTEERAVVAETSATVEPSAPPLDLLTDIPSAMKQHTESREPEVETEVSQFEEVASPTIEGTVQKEKESEESAQESAASIRQAYKPSDRRFVRAKPAACPVLHDPEELLVGIPQQKSLGPTLEVKSGSVASVASRNKALHKKAAELVETRREVKDTWDPESVSVMKKKKRKPKQKRNMQPRAMELFGNLTISKDPAMPHSATDLQKSGACFGLPVETGREHTPLSSQFSDMGITDDPKQIHLIDVENIPSTMQSLKREDLVTPTEDSKTVVKDVKREVMKDDLLAFQTDSMLNREPGELLESSENKTKPEACTVIQMVAKPEGTTFKGKSRKSSECKTAVSESNIKGDEVSLETKAAEVRFLDTDIHQFILSTYPVEMETVEEQAYLRAPEDNKTESIKDVRLLGPIKFDQNQNIELLLPDQPMPIGMEVPRVETSGGAGKASKPKRSRTTNKRGKIPECLETVMGTGKVQGPAIIDRAEELGFIDLSPDVKEIASEQSMMFQNKDLEACIMPVSVADVETKKMGFSTKTTSGNSSVKSEKDDPKTEAPISALMDNKIKPICHSKDKVGTCTQIVTVNVEKADSPEMQDFISSEQGDKTKHSSEIDLLVEQLVKTETEIDKVQIQALSSIEKKETVICAFKTGKGFEDIPSEKPILVKTKASKSDVQFADTSLVETTAKGPGLFGSKKTQRGSLKRPHSLGNKTVKIPSEGPLQGKVKDKGLSYESKEIDISLEPFPHLGKKVDDPKITKQMNNLEETNGADTTMKVEPLAEHARGIEFQRNVAELFECVEKDQRRGREHVELIHLEPSACLDVALNKYVASTESRGDGETNSEARSETVIASQLSSPEYIASIESMEDATKIFTWPPESPKTIDDEFNHFDISSEPMTNLDIELDAKFSCVVSVEPLTKTSFPCDIKVVAPVKDKLKPGLIDDATVVEVGSVEPPVTLDTKTDAPTVAPVKDTLAPGLIDDASVVEVVSVEPPVTLVTLDTKADALTVAPVKDSLTPGLIDDAIVVEVVSVEPPVTLDTKADALTVAPVKDTLAPGIDDASVVEVVSVEPPVTLDTKADALTVATVKDTLVPGLIDDAAKVVEVVSVEPPVTLDTKADAPTTAPVKDTLSPGLLGDAKVVELVSVEPPVTLDTKANAPTVAPVKDKTKSSIEKTSGADSEHSVSLKSKGDLNETFIKPTVKQRSEERSLKTEAEYIPSEYSELKAPLPASTRREIKQTPNVKDDLESELKNHSPFIKLTLQETEAFEQKTVTKDQKQQKKVRGPEQLKGYMRPTKSRGVTSSLMRSAIPDGEKSKQLKDNHLNRQRQEKEKTEALQPHEFSTGVDIIAPPNKELPPSPEKKAKPSAVTPSAKPALAKSRPLSTSSPKRPASATTPTQTKKPASPASSPAISSTPKRPLTSTTRLSSTPRDLKSKSVDTKSPLKSPEKRIAVSKTPTTSGTNVKASPVTPKTPTSVSVDNSMTGSGQKTTASMPKRPTAFKTDVKPADTKKSGTIKSTAAELSRPKTSPVNSGKSNATTPTTPGGLSSTGAVANHPKPLKPAPAKSASNLTTDTKKLSTVRVLPPKPSTMPKQTRPVSAPAPDMKNVRSKIGSTDNIKHQPGGGKVLIQTKKVDISKVSSKCGSKTNIKHKPGGGDVKIESHKINLKGKMQAKVGSLDNVGHVPAGGNVKTEGSEEAGELAQTPENGVLAVPQGLAGSETRENGVGEETVPTEGGDQREIQSFSTQIQETN